MKNQYIVNDQIRSSQIRLIDEDGINHGIVVTSVAQDQADYARLDLVQISDQGDYPTCKILDYGKFRYDQSKKQKEAIRKSKVSTIETKEIWFRPVTDVHDIEIKTNKIRKFLDKGNRIKVGIKFRGRERSRINESIPLLEKLIESLGEVTMIQHIKIQGNTIVAIIGPEKSV